MPLGDAPQFLQSYFSDNDGDAVISDTNTAFITDGHTLVGFNTLDGVARSTYVPPDECFYCRNLEIVQAAPNAEVVVKNNPSTLGQPSGCAQVSFGLNLVAGFDVGGIFECFYDGYDQNPYDLAAFNALKQYFGIVSSGGTQSVGKAQERSAARPEADLAGATTTLNAFGAVMGPTLADAFSYWFSPHMFGTGQSKKYDFEMIWENDFYFYQDFPQINTSTRRDLTPDQTNILLAAGQAAFKAAFKNYSVKVDFGHRGSNTVFVDKGYYFDKRTGRNACGLTASVASIVSQVFYECNMEMAQFALQSNVLSDDMLRAIGRGIGNNAAHEIGHQLNLPSMDDDSTGTYNGGNAEDPAVYNSSGLHWSDKAAATLLRVLGPPK